MTNREILTKIQTKFVKEFGKFQNKKASNSGEAPIKFKIAK